MMNCGRTGAEKRRRWQSAGFVCNIGEGELMRTRQASYEMARKVRLFFVSGCMCFFFIVALFPLSTTGQSEDKKKSEQFSATAFGQSGMFSGKSVPLNIYINEYSSDQEVEELATTLKTKGPDALLRAVQKMKEKGRVASTGRVGWAGPVVRQHPTETGRRIVMFSDRPISFYEARAAPRSKNYEFGMLVLDVNDKGEGEGLLYGACRVKFTKDDQVEVEHFGQAPARLAAVRLWK
jgi:hypothetical protein